MDLLDALRDINGYKEHRKLGDPAEPISFKDNPSIKQIDLEVGGFCPTVVL